jgi:band 4.1-like protein 4A
MSDNESELSRGSGRSGRSHRKHRRHRSRNRSEYGSEYNHNNEPVALIDSGKQWLEVQRKQAEMSGLGNSNGVQQASVKNSSAVTTTTDTYNRNKKNRKHRQV